jgi:hypothetical protein
MGHIFQSQVNYSASWIDHKFQVEGCDRVKNQQWMKDTSRYFLPHMEDSIPIGAYVSEYKFTKSKHLFCCC